MNAQSALKESREQVAAFARVAVSEEYEPVACFAWAEVDAETTLPMAHDVDVGVGVDVDADADAAEKVAVALCIDADKLDTTAGRRVEVEGTAGGIHTACVGQASVIAEACSGSRFGGALDAHLAYQAAYALQASLLEAWTVLPSQSGRAGCKGTQRPTSEATAGRAREGRQVAMPVEMRKGSVSKEQWARKKEESDNQSVRR